MKMAHLLVWSLLAALCASHLKAGDPGEIVFCSNRAGPWRLWSVRSDGSGLKQLTKQENDDQDVDPMFSPDAKEVLFTSTRGGKTGVWRMALADLKPARICDGDQAERRNERIMVRELAAGTERTLSPADWPHCSGPAWSPDGKTLAFAARWEGGNGIFTVAVAGGQPVKVYDKQGACEPHWSPDGTRLVYETETHICTINPDGTKNRVITYFGGVQRYARYSPDGKSLVFCQGASEQGPWELYFIPSAGGTPRKLTEGGSDMYADWK